jgi:hypothetical protein
VGGCLAGVYRCEETGDDMLLPGVIDDQAICDNSDTRLRWRVNRAKGELRVLQRHSEMTHFCSITGTKNVGSRSCSTKVKNIFK